MNGIEQVRLGKMDIGLTNILIHMDMHNMLGFDESKLFKLEISPLSNHRNGRCEEDVRTLQEIHQLQPITMTNQGTYPT